MDDFSVLLVTAVRLPPQLLRYVDGEDRARAHVTVRPSDHGAASNGIAIAGAAPGASSPPHSLARPACSGRSECRPAGLRLSGGDDRMLVGNYRPHQSSSTEES